MTVLRTEGLRKEFSTSSGFLSRYLGSEVVNAVDGVDLTVEEGQTMGLVGESGCGKSTFGRTVLRLHEPTDGRIYFKDTDITEMSRSELRPLRKEMQMVFQNPRKSLNPRQTVGEILTRPMEFHDVADGEAAKSRVARLLSEVGLQPEHANRYPHEFSGGQQQRIGLARALSVDPEFIVLDEPTSALDVSVQAQILELIDDLKEGFDLTLVFISHDLNVIRHVCDEVAVMYLGEIVERAPVSELFDDPFHPYTQALLDSIALPEPGVNVDPQATIEGDVPSPIDPPPGCRFHTRCPQVIPPDDIEIQQEQYRAIMDIRQRIEDRELSLEMEYEETDVEHAIDGDRELTASERSRIAVALADQLLDVDLPQAERAAVEHALERIVVDEWDEAAEILRERYESVCERRHPELVARSSNDGTERRTTSCHLYDRVDAVD